MRGLRPIGALLAVMAALPAGATDLGVAGRTYDIVEPDFRAVIMAQLRRSVDPEALRQKGERALENYMKRIPQYPLATRSEPRVRDVDVTRTVARDIWAPMLDENNKIVHRLVARKGQKIDPFSKGVAPTSSFLVFDGTRPDQVALAREVAKWSPAVYLVAAKGNPKDLTESFGVPVDALNPMLAEIFALKYAPSFVWAARTPEGKVRVEALEMAAPLRLADIQQQWNPRFNAAKGVRATNAAEEKAKTLADQNRGDWSALSKSLEDKAEEEAERMKKK